MKVRRITDGQIKHWLNCNGEKRVAYRFDWMTIERRSKVRARVKAAIRSKG